MIRKEFCLESKWNCIKNERSSRMSLNNDDSYITSIEEDCQLKILAIIWL